MAMESIDTRVSTSAMKANERMEKSAGMESICIPIMTGMKASGVAIKKTERALFTIPVGPATKDIGLMIWPMARE